MRDGASPVSGEHVGQLREGWTYVSAFAPIRTVLALFAIVSFMGVPYTVLMPVFATKILHGGPHTLGFLMGSAGVGSVISAVTLAFRKSVRGLYRVIPAVAALFGAGLIAFSFSRNYWLSLALLPLAGFGMMQFTAASNTVIQTIVEEDKRGRVMSYYTMAYMGASPFGSLLAGGLAPYRRAGRSAVVRRRLRRGRPVVLVPIAEIAARHPPHLSAVGHHPGRGGWRELSRPRALPAEPNRETPPIEPRAIE